MPLPQNHTWQVDLRSWLQGLTVSDFDCGLPGLSYDDSYFSTPDELYRAWITFQKLGRDIVSTKGCRYAPESYVLSSIESGGEVRVSLYADAEPTCMAWLTTWNYPGNPYYESDTVANRALVASIVDLMMGFDAPGGSQEKSSSFQTHAYVYYTCGHLLPAAVQDAYKEYLRLAFDRFEAWVSSGTQASMDGPNVAGMYLAGQILGGGYPDRAHAHCIAFIEKHYHDGYVDHGLGFDPSYNGWSIAYMLWAYTVSGYPELLAVIDGLCKLKSFLTLEEASGEYRGPSSFSTNTAFGSPQDQGKRKGVRDTATAMLSPHAAYLRYKKLKPGEWLPIGIRTESEMRADLAQWTINRNNPSPNNADSWTYPEPGGFDVWKQEWHMELPNMVWELYPGDGYYQQCIDEQGALPPFSREGDFIERFGDKFVIWKLSGFGGAIHTGRLSWWNDDEEMPGFSGGSLCALWTAETGVALLGRQRGYANKIDPDTLETMPTWAVQHVWGYKDGLPYSSGRERYPETAIIIDGKNAMVEASGTLHGAEPVDNVYARRFRISADGLEVSVAVDASGFSELWEAFPFYLGEDEASDGQIQFLVDGLWIDGTTEPVTATAAQIERTGYAVQCVFRQPERVRLSDHVWTTTYQVKSRIRSVMIDVLGTGRARYTFSGAYRESLVKV